MAANPEELTDIDPSALTTEERIIAALVMAGGVLSKDELAEAAHVRRLLLPEYMKKLISAGQVELVGEATYRLAKLVPIANPKRVCAEVEPTKSEEKPKAKAKQPKSESAPQKKTAAEATIVPQELHLPPVLGLHAVYEQETDAAYIGNEPGDFDDEKEIVVHRQHAQALVDWLVATFGLKV